jgi:hypothetical protein
MAIIKDNGNPIPMAIIIINTVFINACPVELSVNENTVASPDAKATPPKPIISTRIHARNPMVITTDTISQKNL